eukprot:scaffold12222_cov53-Prasinocladus_malaysianus.AAC.2
MELGVPGCRESNGSDRPVATTPSPGRYSVICPSKIWPPVESWIPMASTAAIVNWAGMPARASADWACVCHDNYGEWAAIWNHPDIVVLQSQLKRILASQGWGVASGVLPSAKIEDGCAGQDDA